MTTRNNSRGLPQAGVGVQGGVAQSGAAPGHAEAAASQAHEFMVRDLVYQHVIGIGAVRIPDRSPPTPPGMRVRTGRLDWLRSARGTAYPRAA